MLASTPSFTLPNPALVRTVRLRRRAAQLSRYAALSDSATGGSSISCLFIDFPPFAAAITERPNAKAVRPDAAGGRSEPAPGWAG